MSLHTSVFADERALLLACQSGQSDALSTFYERYFSSVYRFVLASIGTREDAEDITAEVFVNAFRGLRSYSDSSRPVTAWLFRIARNAVTDHHRRRGRRPSGPSIEAQQIDVAARSDLMGETDHIVDLSRALRTLPERQRDAVLLRIAAGLSSREAASVMRVPEGTLRSHLHFGLKALREVLDA